MQQALSIVFLLRYGGDLRKEGPNLALSGRLGGRGLNSIAPSLNVLGRLLCGEYVIRFDFGPSICVRPFFGQTLRKFAIALLALVQRLSERYVAQTSAPPEV